jgi:predicted GNAT family N-acyltransferase
VIEVRETRTQAELDGAIALREVVFVGEQGVDRVADQDGLDPAAIHLVAVEDGEVIATCRLLVDTGPVKLGRLAVAKEHRRRGLASRIVAEAEVIARARGDRQIVLNAQTYAEALYAAAGYVRVGDAFLEEGIEHVRMELALG